MSAETLGDWANELQVVWFARHWAKTHPHGRRRKADRPYLRFACAGKCEQIRPMTDFHRDARELSGHRDICRACRKSE